MSERRRDFEEDEDMLAADDDEDAQKDKFLTFSIGSEEYGIEIRHVLEISGIQKITEVPEMPDFIKGVINLRGNIIPVIDVRRRFHMEERAYDDRTCVIVVSLDDITVGLVVDTVKEVISIPAAMISPPPKVAQGTSQRYLLGMGRVGETVKILLDLSKLLGADEIQALEAVEERK